MSYKKSNVFLILFISFIAMLFLTFESEALVIDSFDTHQLITLTSPGILSSSVTSFSGDILGNERDIKVQLISGSGVSVESDLGSFSILDQSQNSASKAKTTITWDGIDNSPILNPTGLGGIDITQGGTNNGISINVLFDDLPAGLDILVYTDSGNWSKYSISLPGLIFSTPQNYSILFSNFITQAGSGANFSNVGAIELFINGSLFGGTDMQFDNFVTIVPEPSTLLLISGALLITLGIRKRK